MCKKGRKERKKRGEQGGGGTSLFSLPLSPPPPLWGGKTFVCVQLIVETYAGLFPEKQVLCAKKKEERKGGIRAVHSQLAVAGGEK